LSDEHTRILLEMFGGDMDPPPLSGATLVIIDAPNEYLDGRLALPGVKPAVDGLAGCWPRCVSRRAGSPYPKQG